MNRRYIGRVLNFFRKNNAAEIQLDDNLKLNDTISICGNTTLEFTHKVSSMQLDDNQVQEAQKAMKITVKLDSAARKNDKVFLLTDEKFHVLLYYRYQAIENPAQFCSEHFEFCEQHNIKGRVFVAKEGINGTVAGLKEDIGLYKHHLSGIFNGIDFKESIYEKNPFRKLFVRTRNEIVVLGQKGISPNDSGKRLYADEFRQILDNYDPKEYVIIDTRNSYEAKIGKFRHAITLDIQNFRDFPNTLAELKKHKEKKVITYCTGGIRCEKASAFLKKHGFKDVYQLDGGIIKFAQKYPKGYYEGLCYVFDDRRAIPIDEEKQTIACCDICSISCNKMINCSNPQCNKQFVCCDACMKKMYACCSQSCLNAPVKVEANV